MGFRFGLWDSSEHCLLILFFNRYFWSSESVPMESELVQLDVVREPANPAGPGFHSVTSTNFQPGYIWMGFYFNKKSAPGLPQKKTRLGSKLSKASLNSKLQYKWGYGTMRSFQRSDGMLVLTEVTMSMHSAEATCWNGILSMLEIPDGNILHKCKLAF